MFVIIIEETMNIQILGRTDISNVLLEILYIIGSFLFLTYNSLKDNLIKIGYWWDFEIFIVFTFIVFMYCFISVFPQVFLISLGILLSP